MCMQKGNTPMNCDVFCLEDITREQFGDINITGNLFLNANGVFKSGDITVGEDLISLGTPLRVSNVKVNGNLTFSKRNPFLFDSLSVKGKCIINSSSKKKTIVPIDCDVFCVNDEDWIPSDICITGNLYIANKNIDYFGHIETGEDIFLENSGINTTSMKSQGTIYVYGEKKRAFDFDSLVALEGCEIYSDIQ